MSDDKKPDPKPQPTAPVLKTIRFRESVTLHKVNPLTFVELGGAGGNEAMVVGASVFVRTADAPEVVEVPRAACILRWAVAPETKLDEAVRQITGGKR